MDTEEALEAKLKRRRLARMRFKAIVHAVMANKFWLAEMEETIGFNYRRNVAIITRRKRVKGILTLSDKVLLMKKHTERSKEEKKKLALIIANLKCFEKFSPKARARLTPVIHYLYYGPQRVIFREGDPPVAMYFILDGEVTVSNRKWCYVQVQKKYVDNLISLFGSGDSFGELTLLRDNVKVRPVTMTTASHVELLVLYESDFYSTIGTEQFMEIKQKQMVINTIEYTKTWDFIQIFLASKLSTIKQYSALQTIYSEDKGLLNSVFFVISGQCMILQCLRLKVRVVNGRKKYSLYEEKKKPTEMIPASTTLFELFQQEKVKQKEEEQKRRLSDLRKEKEMEDIEDKAFKAKHRESMKDDEKILEFHTHLASEKLKEKRKGSSKAVPYCGVDIPVMEMTATADISNDMKAESSVSMKASEYPKDEDVVTEDNIVKAEEETFQGSQMEEETNSVNALERPDSKQSIHGTNSHSSDQERETTVQHELITKYSEESNKVQEKATNLERTGSAASQKLIVTKYDASPGSVQRESVPRGTLEVPKSSVRFAKGTDPKNIPVVEKGEEEEEPYDIENHFVDVGTMSAGAIFGLGENMEHRAIMARTTVYCMLLPRYWLFEKKQNPGNVWQRLQFNLNATIPSREALFKDFLETQKWEKYKKKVIKSTIDKNKAGNPTKIDDIPIICRIIEGLEE